MILWFLPGIILLGIITTYTDLKEGKIKNKHIILALAYTIIIYSILIFSGSGTIRINYFIELTVMCALSLITGFIIWYAGLWTAGDAKLFFAYSALIPLSVYKYGHIQYFDSTNILVNTFVPVFLYMFVTLMFKTNSKQKLHFLKKSFIPKQVLSMAVFLFAFGWLINIIFRIVKIPPDYFITIFILFIITLFFEKLTSLNFFKIVLIISILRLFLDPSVFSLTFATRFLTLLIIFILLRFFTIYIGFYFFTKEVDIKLLQPGMAPAEAVYEEKGRYKKQELTFYSLLGYLEEKTRQRRYIIESKSEGLTEEDVKKLKKLEKQLGFEHLRIQQTTPFAPYIFTGVMLTIILQGNAFIAIRLLLRF